VLLIGRFEVTVPPISRHRRVRIGRADFLVFAALPILPFELGWICGRDIGDVAHCQGFPTHIRPDERSIDMNNLTGPDSGLDACTHRSLKEPAEALGAPTLPDPREAGVIRELIVL
jgi:hypothetical protein